MNVHAYIHVCVPQLCLYDLLVYRMNLTWNFLLKVVVNCLYLLFECVCMLFIAYICTIARSIFKYINQVLGMKFMNKVLN